MEVVLLTQEACAFCDQAKDMLDRLVPEYGFSLRLVDLGTADGEEMARRGGILFPPGLFVDGEAVCYGRPSERRIRKELGRRLGAGVPFPR